MSGGGGSGYVGREVELERLARRLESAVDGRGGTVVVRGPGGMGTTRTANEIAGRADRLGMVTLWGTTLEGLAGRPFGAIAEALEEFGTSLPPAELREQLAGGAPALARMCPRLREVLPDIAPAAPLEPGDERLRLYDAAVAWLRRAAVERPLLLVLDDIGWADEDTRALLDHIANAASGMALLILVTESELAAPAQGPAPAAGAPPAPGAAVAPDEVVDLPGLDEGAVALVLAEIADRLVPAAVAEVVAEVSGGHPLFALELYRHLAEEDRVAAGRVPSAGELPQTLEEVVSWRVSRLPLETRNVLGALACFPLGAPPALLAQVTGMPRARLVEVVERAVAADIVKLSEYGHRYAIYHERVRRAFISATPARVQAAVHGRAAEALEADFGDDARAHASELVDHLVRASTAGPASGGDLRSVRHLLVAAEQARTAGAHRRAAVCVGHAVRLFGEGRRTDFVELVARRALAEAEAGLAEAASRSVKELLSGQRRHGSLTREAWDDVVLTIRTLRYGGEVAAAARVARAALDEGSPRDDLLRARLRLLAEEWVDDEVANLRRLAWRVDETDAAAVVIELGDETDRADVLLAQRPRDRGQSAKLAAGMARWRRPPSVLRGMHGITVDHLTRFGEFREAAALAGRYLASAERFVSLRDIAAALLLLSRARATLGELSTAAEIIAAADDVVARIPEPRELGVERLLADATLAHFRDAEWPALVERIATVRAGPAQPTGLLLAAEQAQSEVRAGREPAARHLIAALLEAIGEVPPLTFGRDAALFGVITAAWEMGAAEYAVAGRTLIDRAVGAGAGGSHAATPRLALARLHGLAGNVVDARELFSSERPRLEAAGLRPLRAILDYDEAITIAAAGSGYAEAGTLLEQAFRQFQGLGMLGWAKRAELLQAGGFDTAAHPGGRLHFSYPAGLSRREADVVRLLAGGASPADAASELELNEAEFQRHLESALEKLGAANLDELPRYARRYGLGGL
jgi:DNA-binding CsgD family transcriptional regulator